MLRRGRTGGPSSRYDGVKRVLDVAVAGGALIVLAPVVLGTALAVRLRLGRPVLFRQARPGRGGEVFEILKFRTMRDVDPARGAVLDEDRLTPFGRRLRASSLDELPSLINVVRGEMSLVGPRPLRTRYLERYSAHQARRHEVLPGLTGLAQVSGRNALSWDDRFDLDVEYVRTRSAATDLRILLATLPKVLRGEGVAEPGQATMRDFFGPRRIAQHEIRALGPAPGAADAARPGSWAVVDRGTGAVVARCTLILADAGDVAAEMRIEVVAGAGHAPTLRWRAAEMLLGVAREQGARGVRIALPAVEAGPAGPWALHGFRPGSSTVDPAPVRSDAVVVLVRSLDGGAG